MGAGSFSPGAWDSFKNTHGIDKKSAAETFSRQAVSAFNPKNVQFRESCENSDKPNVTPIIIALDVTGSMGMIPAALIKGRLAELMKNILGRPSIPNPHIMFMAVGDVTCDRSPLQVTQFEADVRIAEQLKDLFLEGGGGGNGSESYPIAWHFAATRTKLDSFIKRGEKGIIFTIGDDNAPPMIQGKHLREFLGESEAQDMTTEEILAEAQKKYDVFHLGISQSQTYTEDVKSSWNKLLGERHITVNDYTKIDEVIVSTIDMLVTPRNRMQVSISSGLARLSLLGNGSRGGLAGNEPAPPSYDSLYDVNRMNS
jgi:hypothetical protein